MDRPEETVGKTYKIKWPHSEHSLYVTVSDTIDESGKHHPFEIFINSKNMEYFPWALSLTLMISAIFRRGGDISFIVDELRAVHDPKGGAFVGGKMVPSVQAAIGNVIDRHLKSIGYYGDNESGIQVINLPGLGGEITRLNDVSWVPTTSKKEIPQGVACPRCSSYNTKNESGCFMCLDCGHSKCE